MSARGILIVAFGAQYDRLAAHCMAYSRRFTDLPICVLTNRIDRDKKWVDVSNKHFVHFNMADGENRQIKTTMYEHTPFDKTLYIDSDAIIQKSGIEKWFDKITDNSILLNVYGRWKDDQQAPSLYRRAFLNAKVSYPVNIYYGAMCGFTKSPETRKFFALWNQYWRMNGSGREMPALACAVKNSRISVVETSRTHGLFTWPIRSDAIIQHEYGRHVRTLVGCPEFEAFKPFDKRRV